MSFAITNTAAPGNERPIKECISDLVNQHSRQSLSEEAQQLPVFDRKLQRRIDLRLLPILISVYLLNYLDRVNISNVITLGMQKDLGLQGYQLNLALVVFFIPYILCEIPSNILLKRLKPHAWLSLCLFSCGLVVVCHAFLRSFTGLMIARAFLGVVESGCLPGCSYLMSMWYKREESISRFALFYNAITLAGAFGSLLASGIAQMDGVRGLAGWRWIFLLEGAVSCVCAIISFFLIPDFPEDVKWLSTKDRRLVIQRLQADQPPIECKQSWKQCLKSHFSDMKSWFIGLHYIGVHLVGVSISLFLPTILQGFGYSRLQVQLHAVAPFAAAAIWAIVAALVAEKTHQRLAPILFNMSLVLVGVGMVSNLVANTKARYGATFLIACGGLGTTSLGVSWYLMNLRSHKERAIGSGWIIGAGNIGSIAATFSFVKEDAPDYRAGFAVVAAGAAFAAATSVAYAMCCRFVNRSSKTGVRLWDH